MLHCGAERALEEIRYFFRWLVNPCRFKTSWGNLLSPTALFVFLSGTAWARIVSTGFVIHKKSLNLLSVDVIVYCTTNKKGIVKLNFNWAQTGKSIESSVRKACYDYALLGEESVAVALSGGKDSLTLLLMLAALRGRGFPPFDLHAIHVSGVFTCGAGVDIPFLQKFCDDLKVPLHIRTSTQELETLECYGCSRERRSLLFDTAKEAGATSVAFGHHRDDNAQTLLMNLMQKGEFAGMLPKLKMHHYGITIIRPLIYVAEEEIIQFAQQEGFRRIMCRCPVGQNSMRIKVEGLLKEMDALNPHARGNLAQASLTYGSDKASHLPEKRLECSPTRSRFNVSTFQK